MARPLRLLYKNAYYHVMNRGRAKCTIFHGAPWFEAFLLGIQEAHQLFGIEVHAYCLMNNHYHLLIKTPEANLDRAMRHIGGTYTQRHNYLSKTDGPLLRGRYRAIVVQNDKYWFQLGRYIHRNPIETSTPLVKRLQDYRWSSYPSYLGLAPLPDWLYRREMLERVGVQHPMQYRRFIENGYTGQSDIDPLAAMSGVPILGDDAFKQAHLPSKVQTLNEISSRELAFDAPSISEIVGSVAQHYSMTVAEVMVCKWGSGSGQRNTPRLVAMHLCQTLGRQSVNDIAAAFGYQSYGGVSTALYRFRNRLKRDSQLTSDLARIKAQLSGEKVTNDAT